MTARIVLALSALALLSAPEAGWAQEPPPERPLAVAATIVYGDGRPSESATVLAGTGQVLVAAHDLAAILAASRFWRADSQRLTFRLGGHELAVAVGSEVARLDDGTAVHLSGPVLYRDGRVYVPIDLFNDVGGRPYDWVPRKFEWRADRREIHVAGSHPRVRGLRIEPADPNRLDIVLDRPADYRILDARRARFVLRILGPTVDRDSLSLPAPGDHFLALTATSVPGGSEVSFSVPETVFGFQVIRTDRPARLSLVLSEDAAAAGTGRVRPFAEARADTAVLRTVVIDPGHGGNDSGGRSGGGLRESDLDLDLARTVALRLEDRLGVRAILTRDADLDVSTGARTETANAARADIFISIHFDGYPSSSVRGPRAVVVPAGAGGGAGGSAPADLGFTAWGGAQAAQSARAWSLADRLADEVGRALNLPSRGVEEWPLPVLSPAAMPAVFLEIDALTATGADQRFSDVDTRARVADAIVTAIDRYRREAP